MGQLLENVAQYSVPALATLVGVWLSGRRTRQKVDRAIELSEPTGNGFAGDVRSSLARIELDVREVRADLSRHLHDHASGVRPPERSS